MQLISEHGVGFVFQPDDEAGIVNFIKGLTLENRQELIQMGKRARALAEREYSETVLLNKYLELFK